MAISELYTPPSSNFSEQIWVQKCLVYKPYWRGIVGFTGNRQAAPILLDGLSKLEYRGYDSAGLAVRDGENLAQVVKAKGRLSNLIEKTDGGKALKGTCGIGHTRWATHGEPSQTNAHPHVSGNCTRSGSGPVESEVVGVHNGIIENYTELKEKLLKHGYTFYSQTDTEVVVKLVDYYYKKYIVEMIWTYRVLLVNHRKYQKNLLIKAALLEWSFAQSCNASKEPIGEKYLVFYEARTV